jgi:hypothetical protein
MPASAAALIADVFHPARTAPVGLDRRLEAFSVLLEHHPDAPVSAFEASGAPVPVPASVAVGARPTLVHNGMRAVVFIDLDGFKQVNDRSAMPPATSCCASSAASCASAAAARTSSGASAGTSSWSCAPASAAPMPRSGSPNGSPSG